MASRAARELAATAWCQPTTKHLVMIPELVEAFAEILDRLIPVCHPVIPPTKDALAASSVQAQAREVEKVKDGAEYLSLRGLEGKRTTTQKYASSTFEVPVPPIPISIVTTDGRQFDAPVVKTLPAAAEEGECVTRDGKLMVRVSDGWMDYNCGHEWDLSKLRAWVEKPLFQPMPDSNWREWKAVPPLCFRPMIGPSPCCPDGADIKVTITDGTDTDPQPLLVDKK